MATAKCGQKTEVYSRVVGYHRPVKNWNRGKKEEFKDRREYNVALSFQRLAERDAKRTG